MKTVALIAHDQKKQLMLDFVREHLALLSPHSLLATATTGRRLRDELNLNVHTYLSGPLGGDQQIGARIAAGEVDLVIFLRDPLTAQPHEPDITALLRVCDVHNVPVATNLAGADLLVRAVLGNQ
ncbi:MULTISPECIES: methylglyoxal synthase [Sporomusaceae]|uniref:methylglyoxal synthase n=1 Tax=Sporomusaceae TaxID=1843490 RepID=UPI00037FE64C|nr:MULTISPECIES: methylglyoxal synthase [Sporomusaceae]